MISFGLGPRVALMISFGLGPRVALMISFGLGSRVALMISFGLGPFWARGAQASTPRGDITNNCISSKFGPHEAPVQNCPRPNEIISATFKQNIVFLDKTSHFLSKTVCFWTKHRIS